MSICFLDLCELLFDSSAACFIRSRQNAIMLNDSCVCIVSSETLSCYSHPLMTVLYVLDQYSVNVR